MKLQRTTLVLILVALGLGGFVYFYEVRGAGKRLTVTKAQEQQIFSFAEEQVQSFTVKTQAQTLLFERNKSGKPTWLMKAPSETPASDASVSYLLNLLVQGKSDRTFQVAPDEIAEYGLAQPQATITVKLEDNQTHQLILGKPDFNRNFLYAQVDPATTVKNLNVLLVSKDFENAVNRSLSEWKSQNDRQGSEVEKPTTANSASPSPAP